MFIDDIDWIWVQFFRMKREIVGFPFLLFLHEFSSPILFDISALTEAEEIRKPNKQKLESNLFRQFNL